MFRRRRYERLDSGWLVDGSKFYKDPRPPRGNVPDIYESSSRMRHVAVPPPPVRADLPVAFTALLLHSGGKIHFAIQPAYWAGGAWHVPRRDSPIIYTGPSTNTITWGRVDGPRVIFPYGVVNENGIVRVLDVEADSSVGFLTPIPRWVLYDFASPTVPDWALQWQHGVPLNYQGGFFLVPFYALWRVMDYPIVLKVTKYDMISQRRYYQEVSLVRDTGISYGSRNVPIAKYSLNPDGTTDLSSAMPLGSLTLPAAFFEASFLGSYTDVVEDYPFKQGFTAYPGFRYTFYGAYYEDGDYYRMPYGAVFIEFGVLVKWEKIRYFDGSPVMAVYDFYTVIEDDGTVTNYGYGHVAEDVLIGHEPFLSFLPLRMSEDGLSYQGVVGLATTPFELNTGFPGAYLFPILGETSFVSHSIVSNTSVAWPHYFSCPDPGELPLAGFPAERSIAGTKVKRIIARKAGETDTYYKEIPYDFPWGGEGIYLDGVRYGPYGVFDDVFAISAFAPLSSEMTFGCVLPPLSPHPKTSLSEYVSWATDNHYSVLPITLDANKVSVSLGDVPIYTGPLGTIPRPFSGQTGSFMDVEITASSPFALAAVRTPSDPDKIWGVLVQDGLVRIWLWDGRILSGWSDYPLSGEGTLDIPLQEWIVPPAVAGTIFSSSYNPNASMGAGENAALLVETLSQRLASRLSSLDLAPVMLGNYLLPGWPFEVDQLGFDYQSSLYREGLSGEYLDPTLSYAFSDYLRRELLVLHVAYVELLRQGAAPGGAVRAPVVPILATFATGGV